METARAASGENEAKKKSPSSPAMPPRAGAVVVCVVSLLFLWFATRALRFSSGAGDDQVVTAVLWALSPAICAYLFFWTVALSGPTVGDTLFLLARVTFLPLLADAAANLVACPYAGAAAMFLATVYSAAALGRALSFRRLRAGTERSAAAAAMSAPSYRSRAEDGHDRSCRTLVAVGMVFMVVAPFAIAYLVALSSEPQGGEAVSLVASLGPHADDGEAMLGLFMLGAGPFLLVMRHLQLQGSALQADTEAFVWSLVLVVIGCVVIAALAGVYIGIIALIVVIWAGALGMTGFFGYGRALEAQYEQLVAIKRSQPRMAQDASGLLVGRDEEDACSAHIDAASGICLDCVLPKQSRCTC